MSTSRVKQWVLAALIPPAVWIASVVPAEIVFRALGRQPADTILGYYEAFGEQGFKLKPNGSTHVNWWSGPFTVRTDALGLRIPDEGEREAFAKKPEERLWLALGDSQCFGNGLPYEDSIVGKMAAKARARGIYVRNLAVGGHTIKNQIELLEWYMDHTGEVPERVVLFLTPRTVGFPEQYVTAHVQDGEIFNRAPTTEMLARLYLRSYSAAYLTVRDAIKTMSGPVEDEAKNRLAFYDPERMNEETFGRFEGLLRDLQTWTSTRGAAFELAYLPFVVEVQMQNGLVDHPEGFLIDAPSKFAHRAASELGVELVDVRPVMDAAMKDGIELMLRGDSHYSRELSDRGAEFLYEALVTPHLERPEAPTKETPEP